MGSTTSGPARTVYRGDVGYDEARRATMWNANVPDRYPGRIVQATCVADVVAAVRKAKASDESVSVRSGGHSWSGNHVRDGGVLIDLSRLTSFSIDKATMSATVEPGLGGSVLLAALMREGLFFPVGHCRGVGLGGYLLQGGFGWNGRAYGPACASVMAIDYVDADGELRHASDTENSDMLWAARGSGPGFFGVVVKFHLRLYARPRFIGTAAVQYSVDRLEDVVRWMGEIGPDVPSEVELQFVVSRNPSFPPRLRKYNRTSPVRIEIAAPVMTSSRSAAKAALSFLESRPRGSRRRLPLLPVPLSAAFGAVMQHYPNSINWTTDNLWTHAGPDELLSHVQRIADTLPPPPAHFLWLNWAPTHTLGDMAYSVEDRTYLALYGGWSDPRDATSTPAWARDNVAAMESLSTGIQFADDPGRPARGISLAAQARLDALRATQDPQGRFHRWIGEA